MNSRHYLSLAGSTFAGGAAGYLEAHLIAGGVPTTKQQIAAFAAGAALAGGIAVLHLFQTVTKEETVK